MSKIARHTRPEKTPVPTQQQNAFPLVLAIRTVLLATMVVVAAAAHTALNRERAEIVVVCTIRWRTTVALTKIIKMKRLIKLKPFPEVNSGQKIRRKIECGQGILRRGGRHLPRLLQIERGGDCATMRAN